MSAIMSSRPPLLAAIVAVVVALTAHPAVAQSGDAIFVQDGLPDLRLFVHSTDLEQLRDNYQENTYYPADLEFRGVRLRNVGIRSRGSGSRSATKLGLRVDMNRYTKGQEFLGQKSLILDNLWQDPTNVREVLTMKLFARVGLPAPREVFARVFINDAYEGLYAVVEDIDEQFAGRALGDERGTLFEYNWLEPWYGTSRGDDLEPYEALFEAQTNDTDPKGTLYAPLRDLFTASEESGESWRARVEPLLDLRELLACVAVEAFVSELDGVLGYAGVNNFYMFRPSDSLRHVVVPWDKDNAFFDVTSSVWQRTQENVIVEHALSFPDLRESYLDSLTQVVDSAAGEDDWLTNELEAMLALVDEASRQDQHKVYPEEERAAAVEQLRAFVAGRAGRVRAEIAAARAESH
ncbi:MAG TPA: CotH kinase family protein [Luteitalea sp.]|nr:CotH kinase family protein [Luteitalea sp.]